jgi:hypothetical protein
MVQGALAPFGRTFWKNIGSANLIAQEKCLRNELRTPEYSTTVRNYETDIG